MMRYVFVGVTFVFAAGLVVMSNFLLTAGSTPQPAEATAVVEEVDADMSQESYKVERARIDRDFAQYEPAAAYKRFKERYRDKSAYAQHEYAHVFGEALFEHMGISGVAICDAEFAFGCYHSFFGLALVKHGLDIIYDLEAACIEVHGEKGLGCQHGIGHGILAEVGSDELEKALEACHLLKWKGPLGGCMSGVFMEYNFNVMQGGYQRRVVDEDWYYPCNDVPAPFQEACYFEQPAWWVGLAKSASSDRKIDSYAVMAERCDAVQLPKQRQACFRGLGNIIASPLTHSIETLKAYCGESPQADGTSYCLQGAAWLLSNTPIYEGDWERLCEDEVGHAYTACVGSNNMI